ncbi:MAG: CDP-alcohol phosphatidyltransferase family protein [Candidatus Limivivens sp.]|nr:CDP-alcohol phosphatidyltransferase family protein [Candidatus Limivivens sp.]
MIGFYDYTVVLTYVSLMISVMGMTQAIHGRFKTAIFCLALSGLCDMFDGKIARTKQNRTEEEKAFGIQIDSLCDVVCFGAFPALICYLLGVRGTLGLGVIFLYCTCSVIRLGYFNVLEGKRQQEEGGANKYYHGLPITSMAVILPLVFLLQFVVSDFWFMVLLHLALLIVGILFIVDFPFRKPKNSTLAILVTIVAVCLLIGVLYSNYRLPPQRDDSSPIIEEIIGESE